MKTKVTVELLFYEYEGTNINEPVREYITDSTKEWKMTGMVP